MKMEETKCPETSAYKIQTPGNYRKENILYSEKGESLKSRKNVSNIRQRKVTMNQSALQSRPLSPEVI